MANIVENKDGSYSVRFKTMHKGTSSAPLHTKNAKVARERVRRINLEAIETRNIQRDIMVKMVHGKSASIERAVKQWVTQMRMSGITEQTIFQYASYLRQFLKRSHLGGRHSPALITDKHLNNWVNGDDETKASTRKVRLTIANSFLSFCEAKGYILGNPARVVRKINLTKLTHKQKEPKRKTPFNDAEVAALVKFIDEEIIITSTDLGRLPDIFQRSSAMGKQLTARLKWLKFFRAAVPIGRWLGLRIGDVAKLEWDCFAQPGVVIVWTDKRDKRVEIPINEALAGALSKMEKHHERFCFPDEQKLVSKPDRCHYTVRQFERICSGAGIKDRTFHCLRSTFAIDIVSRLVASGKTTEQAEETARQLLGHSSVSTTKRSYLNNRIKEEV